MTESEFRGLVNWRIILHNDVQVFKQNRKNKNEVLELKRKLVEIDIRIKHMEVVLTKEKTLRAATQSA
jgi:hypothetical protein